jgi:hypothetical protein
MSHPTFPRLGAAQQVVAIALLDWCDQDALCFPRVQAIADKLGVHKRRVQDHLGKLGDVGFISFPEGRAGGSSLDTTLVRVDAALPAGDEISTPMNETGDEISIPGVTKSAPLGVTKSAPKPKEVEPNEGTDDARESEKIKTLTDAIVSKLPPGNEPTSPQRKLIDQGNTHNPKLVEWRLRQALTKTKPIAFLTIALKADRDNDWTSRDCPKPPSATKQLASAVTACSVYYGDGGAFEDEIAAWVKSGVDETTLRAALDRQHAEHPSTQGGEVIVGPFKPPARPLDEEAADAA